MGRRDDQPCPISYRPAQDHHPSSSERTIRPRSVAAEVSSGRMERGVLICGSGIGMSIAANRHPGVRAALCHDEESARLAREHNDANILVMGARSIGEEQAKTCLRIFLETEFEGGRHARRVAKLA